MADQKLTDLTTLPSRVAATDALYVVRSGTDYQAAGTDLMRGPANATDGVPALFDGTTGILLKNSTPTGTGNPVLANSPALVNPDLGTPSAGVLTNCTGTAAGLTAGNATVAAAVTAADTASATCNVALTEGATGTQGVKTDAGLTYNATTGVLTATGFYGPLTGNVTGNASGSSGSCTGNAATATALQTARAIYGNNFDGTAALTQVIASTYGGTGNGFTKFTGPTTAEKTFTLPDSSETLLYSGGALGTPSSGTLTNCTGLPEGGLSFTDLTTANATTTAHGLLLKATAPASGVRNVVCIDNGETAYKNSALFDNTNPSALGTAGPGTSLIAARRDHIHQKPTFADIDAGTLAASFTFGENTAGIYDAALSADGKYCGFVRAGTAGAALAFGDLVYLAAADSRWELADADAASTSGDVLLGMCVLAANADGDATTILMMGFIRADTAFPALTIGAPAYVSTTAGDIQTAQPSGTDDVVRRVGFAWTADELYFNPSNDYATVV